jgi:hypothetical protein
VRAAVTLPSQWFADVTSGVNEFLETVPQALRLQPVVCRRHKRRQRNALEVDPSADCPDGSRERRGEVRWGERTAAWNQALQIAVRVGRLRRPAAGRWCVAAQRVQRVAQHRLDDRQRLCALGYARSCHINSFVESATSHPFVVPGLQRRHHIRIARHGFAIHQHQAHVALGRINEGPVGRGRNAVPACHRRTGDDHQVCDLAGLDRADLCVPAHGLRRVDGDHFNQQPIEGAFGLPPLLAAFAGNSQPRYQFARRCQKSRIPEDEIGGLQFTQHVVRPAETPVTPE